MRATWGHWHEDTHRHVVQFNQLQPGRARRFCRPNRIEEAINLAPGGAESDLLICGNCFTRRGLLAAGPPPLPRRKGWVAGHAEQARLPDAD